MLNSIVCLFKLILIVVKIQNIDSASERLIHNGNLINSIRDVFFDGNNTKLDDILFTDDLFVFIENINFHSDDFIYKSIFKILKIWSQITNCNFELLCNEQKIYAENDKQKSFTTFLDFLNCIYFNRNIKKFETTNLQNYKSFNNKFTKHENYLKIIHNKKSIEFQTLNEIFHLYKKLQSDYEFFNLTIIVLEGNEMNKLSLIESVYTNLYKLKNKYIECLYWKLFFNENLIDFFNNQKKNLNSQTDHKKMKTDTDVFCSTTKKIKNLQNANEKLVINRTLLEDDSNHLLFDKNDIKKHELLEKNINNYAYIDDVKKQENKLQDFFDRLKQETGDFYFFFEKIQNIRCCFFDCPIKLCSYSETNFFIGYKIYHDSKRYFRTNDEIQTNDIKKRYCYSIKFKFQDKNILNFSIYAKTKIEDTFTKKKNEIILKETIYIFYDTVNTSYELSHFTYYVKMKTKSKQENLNTDINLSDIKFYKNSEHEYFKEKFLENDDFVPNFNFMPIYNFIKNDEFNDMKKQNSVYYNDFNSESSRSDYEALDNVVVLNVSKFFNDEVIDGQKKITQFFLHLKKILEYWNLNFNYLGLDRSIYDVNFMIDFNEKILCNNFKTNLSVNVVDILIDIKKFLGESFEDADISNEIHINFEPFNYSKNNEFDSNFDYFNKQSFCIQLDSERKKINEIFSTKNLKQNYFLSFNYTLTTKINHQNFILNAQFYHYEYQYQEFCNWIELTGIKNLLCDFFYIDVSVLDNFRISCADPLCEFYGKNDTKKNKTQSFCANINCKFYDIKNPKFKEYQVPSTIYSIINTFTIDFLFGLIHCIKSNENILKGITYHHYFKKNKLIEDIFKNSVLFCPNSNKTFKDFEMASLFFNTEAIRFLEKMISNKLESLEKILNEDIKIPIQNDKIKITAKNEFQFIINFQTDFVIMIAKINELLLFIITKFKEYHTSEKKNTLYCIVTTSSTNDTINEEIKKKIDNFKSKINYCA